MVDHVLILAGGSGTRLWPASNSAFPKQFIPVEGDKSLLQLTIERALGLETEGNVFIITLKDQLGPILSVCEKVERGGERIKIIPEPEARNTAPAIAIAAEYIQYTSGADNRITAAVLTADHLITPMDTFREDMENADALARQGHLVTFGIPPLRPETGYGYIEAGEKNEYGYMVRSFREKPDEDTARSFIEQGGYFWNSGMFAFRVDRYLEELTAQSPDIGRLFSGIGSKGVSRYTGKIEILMEGPEVESIYTRSPKDSIDYAVMEKSTSSAMVRAHFEWNDVGSWEEMAELYAEKKGSTDISGNISGGGSEYISVSSSDNFIYSDLPVALCGVEDLMVVVKNGVVLVAKRGSGQQVKDVVAELKSRGRKELL